MDTVKPTATTTRSYSEKNLRDALQAVRNKQLGKSAACKLYNIPRSTLVRKLEKNSVDAAVKTKPGPPPLLTNEVEDELVKFLKDRAKSGCPLNKKETVKTAEKIAEKLGIREGRLGKQWYYLFMKRHPELKSTFISPRTRRQVQVTEKDLRDWHSEIKNLICSYIKNDQNKIEQLLNDPRRIFNLDKCGFNLFDAKGNYRGSRADFVKVFAKSNEREPQITVMFGCNAAGDPVPATVLYKNERLSKTITDDFPKGWCFGRSPKHCQWDNIFLTCLKNVVHWAKINDINFPIIVFVDNSHITIPTSQYCKENDVILHQLNSKATAVTQPTEVKLFDYIKDIWKSEIDVTGQVITTNEALTITNFAQTFKNFVAKIPKLVYTKAFEASGLYPLDAENIDYSLCFGSDKKESTPVRAIEVPDIPVSLQVIVHEMLEHLPVDIQSCFYKSNKIGVWIGPLEHHSLFIAWQKQFQKLLAQCQQETKYSPPDDDSESSDDDIVPTVLCSTVLEESNAGIYFKNLKKV